MKEGAGNGGRYIKIVAEVMLAVVVENDEHNDDAEAAIVKEYLAILNVMSVEVGCAGYNRSNNSVRFVILRIVNVKNG